MAGQARTIQCSWDAEASVWLATSDDVPGLATGAATLDAPIAKPNVVIPSCSTPTTCSLLIIRVTSPFAVIAERHERAPVAALISDDFAPASNRLLREAGCRFEWQGDGDHETGLSPITNGVLPCRPELGMGI